MKDSLMLVSLFASILVSCGKLETEKNGIYIDGICVCQLNSAVCQTPSNAMCEGSHYYITFYSETLNQTSPQLMPFEVALQHCSNEGDWVISRWLDEEVIFVNTFETISFKIDESRIKVKLKGNTNNGSSFIIVYDGNRTLSSSIYY